MFPEPILEFLTGTGSAIAKGFAMAAGFWIVGLKVSTVWRAFTVACDVE